MNPIRSGRGLIAAALLLSLPALPALADSSIQRIHSTNFGIDQGEIEQIKARMQAAVDGGFLNGALLLVGNDQGVGVLESVGLLSPDNPKPVNSDSIFRIYSMTKPIVSVAIMTMVEDGLMALDDPVSKFIPEFADARVMDRETGELRPARNEMTVEWIRWIEESASAGNAGSDSSRAAAISPRPDRIGFMTATSQQVRKKNCKLAQPARPFKPDILMYPLNNSIHGIIHCRKTKAWFCLARGFNGLRHRIRRHIHVPQGSSDLIRASLIGQRVDTA